VLTGDDLAYATLDYIREHPEEWNQCSYYGKKTAECGTTACFAGHAIILALGRRLTTEELKDIPVEFTSMEFTCRNEVSSTGVAARRLLGWSTSQARAVFYNYSADFARLEARVKQVLNGEIE
jgi:hypothetical protein